MTTEEQLLAAVCADPDDDDVRQIYADFLEESGQGTDQYPDQAEFIRAQLTLCRKQRADPSWWASREAGSLRLREASLLGKYRHEWLEPLLELTLRSFSYQDNIRGTEAVIEVSNGAVFTNGFVSSIHVRADTFLHIGNHVRKVCPLCCVFLQSRPFLVQKYPNTMHLPGYPEVTVRGNSVQTSGSMRWLMELLHENWPGLSFTVPEQPLDTGQSRADLLRERMRRLHTGPAEPAVIL